MAGFKDKFISYFHGKGNPLPFGLLSAVAGQKLVLPFYHTISDKSLPHIRHLYQVKGVKKFETDLDFLLKHYKPLTYPELETLVLENRKPPKPAFLLSFDDGLRELHDIIAPILERKGVPALCFLNSAFIDNKDLFYRYKVSLLLEQHEKQPAFFASPLAKDWLKQHTNEKQPLPQALRNVSYANRQRLDELAKLVEVDFNAFLHREQPYLTTQQVQSLLQRGFHFGAHSVDHPEYRLIPYQEQLRQTKESILKVSTAFSLPYKTFSFPFTDYGVADQFFEEIYRSEAATITFGCAGLKHDTHKRHLQRVALERGNLSAEKILKAELLYFILTAPLGKHKIKRQ